MGFYKYINIPILIFVYLIVMGGIESVEGLKPLSTESMRNVTGAEGLGIKTDQVIDNVELKSAGTDGLNASEKSFLSYSPPSIREDNLNKSLLSLTGDMGGYQAQYRSGSPTGSTSYQHTDVDASGPFYMDMEIVPARPLVRPTSSLSRTSIKLPELTGSTGGEFVINSPGEIHSAGKISMGGLRTPSQLDIRTPQTNP